MGQITVRETSDEVRSCKQIRTRRFGVEIEDIQGTTSTSAEISYCYYVDADDSVFNPKDISMYDGDMDSCPRCGADAMTKQGMKRNRTTLVQQWKCGSCGGWASSRCSEKAPQPSLVN